MLKLKKNLKKIDNIYGVGPVYITDGRIVGTAFAFKFRLEPLTPKHGSGLRMDCHTAVLCGQYASREGVIADLKLILAQIEGTHPDRFNPHPVDLRRYK